MAARPSSRKDFRIAILCPLPLEAEVVKPLFDQIYRPIDYPSLGKASGDPNAYTLGRIGNYDVVLVHMPGAGKAIAASVATHLKVSYPRIELAFLIGICGGVPFTGESIKEQSNKNIHLGDVMISTGIVDYDRVFPGSGDKITPEETLGRPSPEIRSFLSQIKTRHEALTNAQRHYLVKIQQGVQAPCPGFQDDVLYSDDFIHEDDGYQSVLGPKVNEVNEAVVARRRESDVLPFLHFGALASGDSVIMSAEVRDNIARRFGVIGFEMEGAGVWDSFPCILVKGVSDYADSHKSKNWQYFAAASSAACMRAMLDEMPTSITAAVEDVEKGPYIKDQRLFMRSTNLLTGIVLVTDRQPKRGADLRERTQHFDPIGNSQNNAYIRLLTFARAEFRRNEIQEAHQGTCMWLVEQPEYQSWAKGEIPDLYGSIFWIKGKPGAGKSTVMKHLVGSIANAETKCIILSFFFYAKGVELEKSPVGMYRSLLHQLLTSKAVSPDAKKPYFEIAAEMQGKEQLEWSTRDLRGLLQQTIRSLNDRRVFIMIDALDECDPDDVADVILFMQHLVSSSSASGAVLKVCISSRNYPILNIDHAIEFVLEDQPEHQADIKKYVEATLKGGKSKKVQEVKEEICEKASGVFLWVHRVVQSLNRAIETGNIQKMRQPLAEIPTDLDEVFADTLACDNENIDDLVLCLRLVLVAARPLSREELYFAISFAGSGFVRLDIDWHTESIMEKHITGVSRGLVEIVQSKAHFIHPAVREFLLGSNGLIKLRNEDGSLSTITLAHEHISQVSLSYLRSLRMNEGYQDVLRELAELSREVQDDFLRRHVPFIGYAFSNVVYHSVSGRLTGFPDYSVSGVRKTFQEFGFSIIREDGLLVLDRSRVCGMGSLELLSDNDYSDSRGSADLKEAQSIQP
ncbi:hypothetical protein BDW74DRAFT_174053 [Aspergillus multicolor]|uniref:5'-methylthioadenosine/S-adenosylhomocysteine nucleosidase family protein n=1 Tax=Aspergillus multicolor TaxID=41759 RepID=UPI003CCD7D90